MRTSTKLPTVLDGELSAVQQYYRQTAGLLPSLFFKMNEMTGSVASNSGSVASANGSYSSVSLGAVTDQRGAKAAGFNGSSSKVNIYSAAFASAFKAATGTLFANCRYTGDWGGTTNAAVFQIGADLNNRIIVYKDPNPNFLSLFWVAGGSMQFFAYATSSVDWIPVAVTWHKANNRIRFYANGALGDSEQAYTGTWAGALADGWCDVGKEGSNYWLGNIDNVMFFDRELSAAEIATLSAAA